MIKIVKTKDLDKTTRSTLKQYVTEEFGHIPLVSSTQWADPDWTIIYYHKNEIACFYNILEREIIVDGQAKQCAGINNVITLKPFRGKGFASKMLKETEGFIFTELKKDLGLLLCADSLLPYYSKLGWYKIDCPVVYNQGNTSILWIANTMIITPGAIIKPDQINLNGLPW
ncbi:MAG: GNAT family N-acetyltransferase [Chitinophagaceae bacterium]